MEELDQETKLLRQSSVQKILDYFRVAGVEAASHIFNKLHPAVVIPVWNSLSSQECRGLIVRGITPVLADVLIPHLSGEEFDHFRPLFPPEASPLSKRWMALPSDDQIRWLSAMPSSAEVNQLLSLDLGIAEELLQRMDGRLRDQLRIKWLEGSTSAAGPSSSGGPDTCTQANALGLEAALPPAPARPLQDSAEPELISPTHSPVSSASPVRCGRSSPSLRGDRPHSPKPMAPPRAAAANRGPPKYAQESYQKMDSDPQGFSAANDHLVTTTPSVLDRISARISEPLTGVRRVVDILNDIRNIKTNKIPSLFYPHPVIDAPFSEEEYSEVVIFPKLPQKREEEHLQHLQSADWKVRMDTVPYPATWMEETFLSDVFDGDVLVMKYWVLKLVRGAALWCSPETQKKGRQIQSESRLDPIPRIFFCLFFQEHREVVKAAAADPTLTISQWNADLMDIFHHHFPYHRPDHPNRKLSENGAPTNLNPYKAFIRQKTLGWMTRAVNGVGKIDEMKVSNPLSIKIRGTARNNNASVGRTGFSLRSEESLQHRGSSVSERRRPTSTLRITSDSGSSLPTEDVGASANGPLEEDVAFQPGAVTTMSGDKMSDRNLVAIDRCVNSLSMELDVPGQVHTVTLIGCTKDLATGEVQRFRIESGRLVHVASLLHSPKYGESFNDFLNNFYSEFFPPPANKSEPSLACVTGEEGNAGEEMTVLSKDGDPFLQLQFICGQVTPPDITARRQGQKLGDFLEEWALNQISAVAGGGSSPRDVKQTYSEYISGGRCPWLRESAETFTAGLRPFSQMSDNQASLWLDHINRSLTDPDMPLEDRFRINGLPASKLNLSPSSPEPSMDALNGFQNEGGVAWPHLTTADDERHQASEPTSSPSDWQVPLDSAVEQAECTFANAPQTNRPFDSPLRLPSRLPPNHTCLHPIPDRNTEFKLSLPFSTNVLDGVVRERSKDRTIPTTASLPPPWDSRAILPPQNSERCSSTLYCASHPGYETLLRNRSYNPRTLSEDVIAWTLKYEGLGALSMRAATANRLDARLPSFQVAAGAIFELERSLNFPNPPNPESVSVADFGLVGVPDSAAAHPLWLIFCRDILCPTKPLPLATDTIAQLLNDPLDVAVLLDFLISVLHSVLEDLRGRSPGHFRESKLVATMRITYFALACAKSLPEAIREVKTSAVWDVLEDIILVLSGEAVVRYTQAVWIPIFEMWKAEATEPEGWAIIWNAFSRLSKCIAESMEMSIQSRRQDLFCSKFVHGLQSSFREAISSMWKGSPPMLFPGYKALPGVVEMSIRHSEGDFKSAFISITSTATSRWPSMTLLERAEALYGVGIVLLQLRECNAADQVLHDAIDALLKSMPSSEFGPTQSPFDRGRLTTSLGALLAVDIRASPTPNLGCDPTQSNMDNRTPLPGMTSTTSNGSTAPEAVSEIAREGVPPQLLPAVTIEAALRVLSGNATSAEEPWRSMHPQGQYISLNHSSTSPNEELRVGDTPKLTPPADITSGLSSNGGGAINNERKHSLDLEEATPEQTAKRQRTPAKRPSPRAPSSRRSQKTDRSLGVDGYWEAFKWRDV